MKRPNLNGWVKKNVVALITVFVLSGSVIAQAAIVFNNQAHMQKEVTQNCVDIEKNDLKMYKLNRDIGDDLSDIKGDIKEIKAILRERDTQ